MKLAATLMGGGGDCLKQAVPGPATLCNPENDFFVIGMKSYGRGSAFLLRVGFEQVRGGTASTTAPFCLSVFGRAGGEGTFGFFVPCMSGERLLVVIILQRYNSEVFL